MTQQKPLWRLIDTGPLDGPANMALDEALLTCFDQESSLPVLRLYGWHPPALSVGRYQDAQTALHLDLCSADWLPVVRRMTGGGIILHAEELTYSIVCSPRHLGAADGVKDGFRKLCGFLLHAYRRLGLNASFAVDAHPKSDRLGVRTEFCFAGKEEYDLLVDGRKVGGNAQRRLRGVIMQHGSIPLQSQVRQAAKYLREPAPGAAEAASLAELGIHQYLPALKKLVAESFEESMGVRLEGSSLTREERAAAARLEESKYRRDCWNLNGCVDSAVKTANSLQPIAG